MRLFVVGKYIDHNEDGTRWDFHGAFTKEKKAVSQCIDYTFFVGPTELDVPFPLTRETWPGLYYPIVR